jgi:hypothetical protein
MRRVNLALYTRRNVELNVLFYIVRKNLPFSERRSGSNFFKVTDLFYYPSITCSRFQYDKKHTLRLYCLPSYEPVYPGLLYSVVRSLL